MNPLLVLRGIHKRFPGFTAIEQLDLTIPAGSFFALLGASGCGMMASHRQGMETGNDDDAPSDARPTGSRPGGIRRYHAVARLANPWRPPADPPPRRRRRTAVPRGLPVGNPLSDVWPR